MAAIDPKQYGVIARGDVWKLALIAKARWLARAGVLGDPVAHDLLNPWPTPPSAEVSERLRLLIEATSTAAVAAVLIDELSADRIAELAGPWVQIVELNRAAPPARGGASHGLRRRLRRVLDWFERHPSIALAATLAVVAPLIILAPIVGGLLFLALLVVAAVAAISRSRADRWRARRRREVCLPP